MSDERVVPGVTAVGNVSKHIARYNVALQFASGKKTLDVACGTGYGSFLLSMVASSVAGLDIDYSAIEHAKQHFKSDNLTFVRAPFDTLKNSTERYDCITCFETLEHLEDLYSAQKILKKLLNPGGVIVFSVPLNEEMGFNEHHKHTFKLGKTIELFEGMTTLYEGVQQGVNFYPTASYSPDIHYIYYIRACTIG